MASPLDKAIEEVRDLRVSKTKLLPCPFCGSRDIEIIQIGRPNVNSYVRCNGCGCGLSSPEQGDATGRGWNTRVDIKGDDQ